MSSQISTSYTLPGDVILSPMDGYSDLPFRSICRELGSAMSYTEFVNALDILNNHPYIQQKLSYLTTERPIVYQLFDNDPDRLFQAALRLMTLEPAAYPGAQIGQPDVIDINLGCSAKNVSGRGAGAGLLKTPEKIAEIFRKLTSSLPVPVTAKIRIGWDDDTRNYLEVAKILEENGAAAIAVHGRTKQQAYRGEADWNAIAEVQQTVSVPVIANGDVRTTADIDRLKAHTGCPAVMIGRGAIGNPWIFSRLDRKDVPLDMVRGTIFSHFDRMLNFHGDRGLILFRKHVVRYLKVYKSFENIREQLLTTLSVDEFRSLVDQVIITA